MGQPLRLFIVWLLVAVTALTLSYTLLNQVTNNDDRVFTFNQVRLLTNPALSEAEANYHLVQNYNAFAPHVSPHLAELNARMQIIAVNGRLLFDSNNALAYQQEQYLDIRSQLHYDASFRAGADGLVRFAFPLVVADSQVANAVFYLPQDLVTPDRSPLALALLPLLTVLVLALLTMVLVRRRFQTNFLRPLQTLTAYVNNIARGNLDDRIKIQHDDELGKLSQSVDIMRLELKDLLARQAGFETARKELITKISHDLKTPIASIKAYVEGLKTGIADNPETVDKYLGVIDRKTDSLTALVDDLLQHSLQELGQLRIHKQEQYSKRLLAAILEPLSIQFENSPLTFSVAGDLPDVLLNVDGIRLEQVIVNLVQNAKKYTAAGGEIVFCAVNEADYLRISIRDTGTGVPAGDLPHIFDDFYRSPEVARDFEGAGLGLAICKYIVEQHGGRIWVDSKLHEGSTFTFTIAKA